MSLFDGIYFIAIFLQRLKRLNGRLEIDPFHTILCTQGCLMNLSTGRNGGYTTQIDCLDTESITCTKHTTHIMHGSHIVEYYYQR